MADQLELDGLDIRVPDDHDFARFRNLANVTDSHDDWVLRVNKTSLKVWIQTNTESALTGVKMMKVSSSRAGALSVSFWAMSRKWQCTVIRPGGLLHALCK